MKKINLTYIIIIILTFIFFYISMKNDTIEQAFVNLSSKTSYFIHCDLDDCNMYVFKDYELIKKYRISGGKDSTRSPYGVWTIISKDTWGEGFGGRWLGINVPWGKYGIHGTRDHQNLIGSNSSHGCIRMSNKDVKELFKIVPHGTRVSISQGLYGPFGSYYRTLKNGTRGADVYAVQLKLQDLGYFKGYVNGIYGNDLDVAINKFQKDKKLPIRKRIGTPEYEKMGFIRME